MALARSAPRLRECADVGEGPVLAGPPSGPSSLGQIRSTLSLPCREIEDLFIFLINNRGFLD